MIVIKNSTARNILRYLIPLLLIPALVLIGALVFADKRYIIISLGIAVLSVLLFIAGVERRNIGSRRLVLTAVMIALCVVGRMIPLFKPVTALTVIVAMYLGAESGFLTGAMAALLSNFFFGQGPWTPFQMLAWGLIGLLAGYLSPLLIRSRAFLLTYGVLSGVAFSFIMDIWTVLWYNGTFSLPMYLGALSTAVPYTIMYAVSNLIFLLLLARPMGEKLARIKLKYGV